MEVLQAAEDLPDVPWPQRAAKRRRLGSSRASAKDAEISLEEATAQAALAALETTALELLSQLSASQLQQVLCRELAQRARRSGTVKTQEDSASSSGDDSEGVGGEAGLASTPRKGSSSSASWRLPSTLPFQESWALSLPFILAPGEPMRQLLAVSRTVCTLALSTESWLGLRVDLPVTAQPPPEELVRMARAWSRAKVVSLDLRACPSPGAAAAVAEALARAAPTVRVELQAPRGFHKNATGRLVELRPGTGGTGSVAAVRGHDSRTPACLSVASYCCGAVVVPDGPLRADSSTGSAGVADVERFIDFEAVRACSEHRCSRGMRLGITASFPAQMQEQLRGARTLRDSIHEVRHCLFINIAGELAWRDADGAHHPLGRHTSWGRAFQRGDRLRLALRGRWFEVSVNSEVVVSAELPTHLISEELVQSTWWAVLDLSRGLHSVALVDR